MKISKEIKTALFVIAALFLFIWGYSFLEGRDLFNSNKTLYVQYDNVEGLTASAPITINGLVVGRVHGIRPANPSGKPIIVELQIDSKDFFISHKSVAGLYAPGLIGGKQIQILLDPTDQQEAKSGDTLRAEVKTGMVESLGSKLEPLAARVETLLVSTEKMVTSINQVLDEQTKANLRKSIANLNGTLAEFNGASRTLNQTLAENRGKISNTMTHLEKASGNFAVVSDSLAKIEIGKSVKQLELALTKVNGIMTDLNAGKGTAGKLLKDETLYRNLSQTSKELELLLQDLRLNPTRYINVSLFGKKNKPYKAPQQPADTLK